MKKVNNITLVILAGGDNNRMGISGKITPKPLMSTLDECLIVRHIRHAKEANINKIIISTNNKIYKRVKECLKYWGYSDIKVINNPEHKKDSLSALYKVINTNKIGKLVMSFADIFFLENPYLKFINENHNNFLGISPVFNKKELTMGGIVFLKSNKNIEKIVELPFKDNKKGFRWNGLACFDISLKNELKYFLESNKSNVPEGDFFDYMIKRGITFNVCQCSDFINVNRPEDLLSASLYRYAELSKSKNIRLMAEKIRENYIKNFSKLSDKWGQPPFITINGVSHHLSRGNNRNGG